MTHRGSFQPLTFCDSVKTSAQSWFVSATAGKVYILHCD